MPHKVRGKKLSSEICFSPGESRLRGVDNRAGWSLGSVWMTSQLLSVQNLHFSLLCRNIHMDISAKLWGGKGAGGEEKNKDRIWVKSKHRYHFWCETIKNDIARIWKQVLTCEKWLRVRNMKRCLRFRNSLRVLYPPCLGDLITSNDAFQVDWGGTPDYTVRCVLLTTNYSVWGRENLRWT